MLLHWNQIRLPNLPLQNLMICLINLKVHHSLLVQGARQQRCHAECQSSHLLEGQQQPASVKYGQVILDCAFSCSKLYSFVTLFMNTSVRLPFLFHQRHIISHIVALEGCCVAAKDSSEVVFCIHPTILYSVCVYGDLLSCKCIYVCLLVVVFM